MENGRGTAVIEVRLLGVVQLHVDGERVDLRGPRQQRLLAFLGLNRDRVVGFDRLAEAVWPDGDFPTDPRATLWTYVSRLRRSLGSADALERLDNGYVLRGDGVTVDAATFEEVARPNPSAAPSQRADALERVLSSWRGPALDGFEAEPWAQADAVRLNELRIAAVEERAACLIDSGQLQQAIVELESATADHPTRESTHLLLMRALDGAGRRGEALRVFNLYARRLSTELGLQPGEAIAEVERNIHAAESAAHDPRQVRGYELGERIGDGAFAVVYKATHAVWFRRAHSKRFLCGPSTI